MTLLNNRFLTFNSVVRVNQIEVGRDQFVGSDEAHEHTPENMEAFRDAFARGWPGAAMTWGFSWLAFEDDRPQYRAIRELARKYHRQHGDEITFLAGGYFANAYNTREQVNRDLHDGLARVSHMMGSGYRPRSVLAGFLAAENQRYLAEVEKIHVCQGNIWSQYSIDNQDGDGSISYPYYPSREHFCKPAQSARGSGDFIDCVNLDGWTCDFLEARRAGMEHGYNKRCSRRGVGPIENILHLGDPELGLKQMVETVAVHFDRGFELNRLAWICNCWELCLVAQMNHLEHLSRWLSEVRRRWPDARCMTQGEFGLIWREHHRDNADLDYRFEQRGTGIGGSDANMEIRWFMNRDFRLALLRDWQRNTPEQVIDFTRYDPPAHEPQDLSRNWSLINVMNQKGLRPEDAPREISSLAPQHRERIAARYPQLLG